MKVQYDETSIAIVVCRLRIFWADNLVLKIQGRLCQNFGYIYIHNVSSFVLALVTTFHRRATLFFCIKNDVWLLQMCFSKKEKYMIQVIVSTGMNKLALIQLDKKKRNDSRWIHNP
jgi:hypothetical protein